MTESFLERGSSRRRGRRVLHVINDLGRGGAQTVLVRLAQGLGEHGIESRIASILPENVLGEDLEKAECQVEWLGASGLVGALPALVRLRSLVARFSPHIIQGWMYHSSLLSSLGRLGGSSPPVFWNIRHTPGLIRDESPSTAVLLRTAGFLSRQPKRIIYNSHNSRRWHERAGFDASKGIVIPNGFDLSRFHPDPEARKSVRRELGESDDVLLVGMLARFHPMKDHDTFIHAAAHLAERIGSVRFLLAGPGVSESTNGLSQLIEDRGLSSQIHLMGDRDDTPRLLAALDVATLTSAWGEGMPNVIGEAMACGVPAVVTRVGDAGELVGPVGRTVPPRDPIALACAWYDLLTLDNRVRREVTGAARDRIRSLFSLERMIKTYADLYRASDSTKPARE